MKIKRITDIDKRKIVLDGCMATFIGEIFDLMNPNPEQIKIKDIAHGLAFNCRCNGHTKNYYSVAEHSIRMSRKVSKELRLTFII